MTQIIRRHWRTMNQDPYLAEVFPQPPLVAYKRPQNIKDKLIRAKIPDQPTARPKRNLPGMKKCNNCPICPSVTTGRTVEATQSNYKVDIDRNVDCQTKKLIYCVECKKCSQQYIGETKRSLQDRFSDHLGYVRNKKLHKATGQHFTQK